MSEAPERIWACYDAVKNRAYWAGPDGLYQTDCLVGEYIRADLAAERERKLVEVLDEIIDAYIDSVDAYRTAGFYQDPETDDVIVEARAIKKELGYE